MRTHRRAPAMISALLLGATVLLGSGVPALAAGEDAQTEYVVLAETGSSSADRAAPSRRPAGPSPIAMRPSAPSGDGPGDGLRRGGVRVERRLRCHRPASRSAGIPDAEPVKVADPRSRRSTRAAPAVRATADRPPGWTRSTRSLWGLRDGEVRPRSGRQRRSTAESSSASSIPGSTPRIRTWPASSRLACPATSRPTSRRSTAPCEFRVCVDPPTGTTAATARMSPARSRPRRTISASPASPRASGW